MWNKGKDCQRQSLSFFTKMNEMARTESQSLEFRPRMGLGNFLGSPQRGPLLDVTRSQVPSRRVLWGGAPWRISGTHPESELEACAQSLYIVYIIIL